METAGGGTTPADVAAPKTFKNLVLQQHFRPAAKPGGAGSEITLYFADTNGNRRGRHQARECLRPENL